MEKSHRTEEPITESVESSRVTVISQPDFVDLGAVPKTPLQRAMRVRLYACIRNQRQHRKQPLLQQLGPIYQAEALELLWLNQEEHNLRREENH